MRKIFSIGPKDFLTSIAPSAHTEAGGLWFKADGINPVYDPGGTESIENGLLQAGAAGIAFGDGNNIGSTADTIFCGESYVTGGTAYLFMMGKSGHFYLKAVGSGDMIDRAATNQIANSANGLTIWGPAGGTVKLYYWQREQIGAYDMTGNNHPATADSHWNDAVYTGLYASYNHQAHKFQGNVYYANGPYIGALLDNGSGGVTHSSNVLDFPTNLKCTAISDDGTYLVAAVTENSAGNDTFAKNKVVFWDLYSSQWTREYDIRDPFIWAIKKIGNTNYAFGQYGIYEVSFGGVTKILSRLIGFGTMSDLNVGYGANRATVYNGQALIFGTDTTVDTFGKLSPELKNAYLKPFKIPSNVGTPTFISTSLDSGRVYVATDGGSGASKFYGFDFNATTRGTGVSAQTVYLPLGDKYQIERVDVIFGEPLASGDSMNIQLKTDEDSALNELTANRLTATYANDGAIRRKSMLVQGFFAEEQLSVVINFVAGAPKIKRIEIYGSILPVK